MYGADTMRADKMQADTLQTEARVVRAQTEVQAEGIAARQLLKEHHMEIYVNEQLAVRLVCTANDLENLVVGRLVSEGIITEFSEIERIYLCESGNRARVFLKGEVTFQPKVEEEPTCCTENHVYLCREENSDPEEPGGTAKRPETSGDGKAVKVSACGSQAGCDMAGHRPEARWTKEWIFGLANAFAEDSRLHKSTGGTHSCMLAVEDRIVYQVEDIGRHNALDKAIGYAVRNLLDRQKCILFTTGRVPTDMVKKVVAAGMPVLVSKAVPTVDAVELAKTNGLTLICRAWPDSFEVYA